MTLVSKLSRAGRMLVVAAGLTTVTATAALADPITFGTPPWPGLTVKTEITEQLLQALGYQTKTRQLGLPFIYRDLSSGEIDAFLGAWMPTEKQMLEALVKQDKVVNLGPNLNDALMGLAVPEFVWKSGIHSLSDLTSHAARFDKTIYGIESGSEINNKISTAIQNNDQKMGVFHLQASSTAVMLTQVQRAISKKQPIVFIGWRPHWMNIQFNMHYLKGPKASNITRIKSTVLTIVNQDFANKEPNVKKLLGQIHVDDKTQSRWINSYSYKKEPLKKVADDWLKTHPKVVSKWLANVTTEDGKPADQAYRQAFGVSR